MLSQAPLEGLFRISDHPTALIALTGFAGGMDNPNLLGKAGPEDRLRKTRQEGACIPARIQVE